MNDDKKEFKGKGERAQDVEKKVKIILLKRYAGI